MKQFFSWLTAAAMLLSMLSSAVVFAETGGSVPNSYAYLAEDTALPEIHEEADRENAVFVKSWQYIQKHTAKVTVKNTTADKKTVQVLLAQYEPAQTEDSVPAFPGAEGGGKYTKGARGVLDNAVDTTQIPDSVMTVSAVQNIELESGAQQEVTFTKIDLNSARIFLWDENNTPYCEAFYLATNPAPTDIEVYHVTSLESEGEGTLRDALSREGRVVVFDVGGIINVPDTLYINNSNITILGQTAPGDGITLTGGDLRMANGVKNIIIRYMRIRPTDDTGNEVDALGGQWNTDIIFDHCSASWCIDECLTLYAGSAEDSTYAQGKRLTVQNTISSESLRMSNHFKGAHGYGAIIGGTNATYWRNLFAHHDSRSPRLDRALNKTDFRNNVVYNWGVTNSAYGGEPTSPHPGNAKGLVFPSLINYSNNYYKFGPSTVAGKRYRIYDFKDIAKEVGKTYHDKVVEPSKFYLTDNYVFGSSTVTKDNWANDGIGGAYQKNATKMTTPFSLGDEVYSDLNIPSDKLLAGKDCLDILSDVGATLPKRDNIDARVIEDVKNQTGRIINRDEEVGAFTGITEAHRTFEIPADWKAANGMGSSKESDIVTNGKFKGYTWIEAYVNDWTEQQSAPTNPTVTVTSPAIAAMSGTSNKSKWAVIKDNETLSYKAAATPADGTSITKMELYDEEKLIKTYDGAAIDDSISLATGTHYLTSLAYNDKGESTRSTTSIVYVNGSTAPEGWSHKQIGTTSYSGKGAISYFADKDQYMIGGSGKIAGDTKYFDLCDFMYKEVTGDFDISLKIDELPKNENGASFGLMLRETLDSKSRMASIVDGWIKYGRNDRIMARTETGKGIYKDPAQTNSTDNKMGAFMSSKDGKIISGNVLGERPYDTYPDDGIDPSGGIDCHLPNYLRIQRSGDTIKLSVSDSGEDYTDNIRQPYTLEISGLSNKLYVGVVIDSQMNQSDASPQLYYSQARFSELKLTEGEAGFDPSETPAESAAPKPTSQPIESDKYNDWNLGLATETEDAKASAVSYSGKDALYVENRNVYKVLETPISSGKVTFDTDVYIDTTVPKNFRIYFENAENKITNTDAVFAQVVYNDASAVIKGPALDSADTLFPYSNLSESGWVHFKIELDYANAGTNEFITVTATAPDGTTELGTAKMGAISGKDTTLKSIRLIQTAKPAYFADMNLAISE